MDSITGRIGALELNAEPLRLDDGTLETIMAPEPSPTKAVSSACIPTLGCRRIDDGMLEESASAIFAGPTGMVCAPPPTSGPVCPRHIDG